MTSMIMNFPVLQRDSGDFIESVSYSVSAEKSGSVMRVEHILKGQSFVREWVLAEKAAFSVLLLYRDSAERQVHKCLRPDVDFGANENEIVAVQSIELAFSYAPQVMPSIVVEAAQEIKADDSTGLTDFWEHGKTISVPPFARIAIAPKLDFTSGGVSGLISVMHDENLADGEMQVDINPDVGEGERPVTLCCGKQVFDLLKTTQQGVPTTPKQTMQSAIATHALCAVYADMKNLLNRDPEYEVGGVLGAHLDELYAQTGLQWDDENFNPSLAATKMWPYVLHTLNRDSEND